MDNASPIPGYVVNFSSLYTAGTIEHILSSSGVAVDKFIPEKGEQVIICKPGKMTVAVQWTDEKSPDNKRLYRWLNLVREVNDGTR